MVTRNFDCEILTPDIRKSKQEEWSRVAGDQVALNEEKGFVTCGQKKGSVRSENNVVSGMRVMIVQNRHQKTRHLCSTNSKKKKRGRSAPRKRNVRGRSQSGKFNRQPCKYVLTSTCTKSPCEFWHPPECQLCKSESGCKCGAECSNMWIQTILSCGNHSTTMQIRIISRFWFCRRPGRFKINITVSLMHFQKSIVRANKLDVQETDFSFTKFQRKLKLLLSMQVYAWMELQLLIFGLWL